MGRSNVQSEEPEEGASAPGVALEEYVDSLINQEEEFYDDANLTGLGKLQLQIWLTFEDTSYSVFARIIQSYIMFLIFLSTGVMLVQSEAPCYWDGTLGDGNQPYARLCDPRPEMADEPISYFILESICIISFTIELVLRLFASPATVGVVKFCTSPMNIIDLVAIVPYYLELPARVGASAGGGDLSWLRVVRLIRIARILKVTKSLHGFQVLIRTLGRSSVPLLMLVGFVAILCFLFASIAALFEQGTWEADEEYDPYGYWIDLQGEYTGFENMLIGWYWCVQTLTSVGYGSPTPKYPMGKVVGTLAAMGGVIVLSLPITIIGANFEMEFQSSRRWADFQRRSRVVRCSQATRNGTRTVQLPAAEKKTFFGKVEAKDENFADQAHNLQADLDSLLGDHFVALRERVDTMLAAHSDTLAKQLHTDVKAMLKTSGQTPRKVKAITAAFKFVGRARLAANAAAELRGAAEGSGDGAAAAAPPQSELPSEPPSEPSKPLHSPGEGGQEMKLQDAGAAVYSPDDRRLRAES